MPSLTNPWVLTALVILAVVAVALTVRVTHRLRHGKTPTAFAPLPVTQRPVTVSNVDTAQKRLDDDEDPLLAKGA
jgi:hypothetical protein